MVHRVLIFPHEPRRASAAAGLQAHGHLDVLYWAAEKMATAKLSGGEVPAFVREHACGALAFTVHPSAAASRPAASANPAGGAPILSSSNVRRTTVCAATAAWRNSDSASRNMRYRELYCRRVKLE